MFFPDLKKIKRPVLEEESQKKKVDNIVSQQKSEDQQLKEMYYNPYGFWETSPTNKDSKKGTGLSKLNELSRNKRSPPREP